MRNDLINLSEIYYNESLRLVKTKKLTKALTLINDAVEINRDDDILNLRGLILLNLNYIKESRENFNYAISINKNNQFALRYLQYINSQEFIRSEEFYKNSIKYFNNGDYKRALGYIDECIRVNNQIVDFYNVKAFCLMKLKRYNEARICFNKVLEIDEENTISLKYAKMLPKDKWDKFTVATLTIVAILIVMIAFLGLVYNENEKKIKGYREQVSLLKVELDNSKISDEVIYEEFNERELINNASKLFKDKKYNEAFDVYERIYKESTDIKLVEESCFYLGAIGEILNKNEIALKYYSDYITRYGGSVYYGEVLYNAAQLAYRTNNKIEAKEYSKSIEKELPGSIYYNSKIKYILNSVGE